MDFLSKNLESSQILSNRPRGSVVPTSLPAGRFSKILEDSRFFSKNHKKKPVLTRNFFECSKRSLLFEIKIIQFDLNDFKLNILISNFY